MVEPIMYFAIGFLISTLVGLGILPLVHNRAVRLTTKRLEAATPVSMAEIQADKDHLRAEFAMSARRLEMSVEQLKAKTTTQLAELGKKSDIINRMKYELGEKNATIFQLEARERSVKDSLKSTEAEFASKTESLREAETRLAEKQAELGKLGNELSTRSQIADARQIELTTVNAQITALQQRVNEAERDFLATQDKLTSQQTEATEATKDLEAARSKISGLSNRVGELEGQLDLQAREAQKLAARASDFEGRLAAQNKMLTDRGVENHQLRQQVETLQKKILQQSGTSISETALATLRAEKTAIESEFAAMQEERGRLQRELNAIRKQSESSWASERMENAVLRERINDVAAEVARLAMSLEGPDSPIEALLAVDASADQQDDRKVTTLSPPANANRPVGSGGTPQSGTGKGTLADRIRALQNQSSRTQQA